MFFSDFELPIYELSKRNTYRMQEEDVYIQVFRICELIQVLKNGNCLTSALGNVLIYFVYLVVKLIVDSN